MKITLEIDFGKEFDACPIELVHDALIGIETRMKRDMITLWNVRLDAVKAKITGLEVASVINS